MFTDLKYELLQLFRRPLWLVLFFGSIGVSVILPRANMTDFYVLPSMVYFVMTVNLLFLFFGAEEARLEQKNHLTEQLKPLPFYNRFRIGKLLYWFIVSLLYYLVFYIAVVSYIHFVSGESFTSHLLQQTLLYTFFVWLIPFFFSIIIGYLLFSLLPNITSYILIILVWFLIMPYNSMLGFIPASVGAWLINGDPNVTKLVAIYDLESLQVNKGYFFQRGAMFLLLLSLYTLSRMDFSKKAKPAIGISLMVALLIPFLSPYVPQIDNKDNIFLSSNDYMLPEGTDERSMDYDINKYDFTIDHGENMHELRYEVDITIDSKQPDVLFALWDDFQVLEASFNEESIDYSQSNNLVSLTLPELEGDLTFSIKTDSYLSIAPTTYQLIATTPWYPMNPSEAVNPYNGGKKENYILRTEDNDSVFSNLTETEDGGWQGEAYGPTLVRGGFTQEGKLIYPRFKEKDQVNVNIERIKSEIPKINEKLGADKSLTCGTFIVTTTYPAFNANPEECYVFKDERVVQSANIISNLYLGSEENPYGRTFLFRAVYQDMLTHESWQNLLKKRYEPKRIETITEYYQQLSSGEREKLIKEWYDETKGVLSPERMIADMEDLYAEG